jgi:hypothetical protein
MVAPKDQLGYSHLIKKGNTITGVINDDKVLFGLHIEPLPPLADKVIYHANKNKSIFVATQYKVIGDEADTIRGAIFALSNLDMSTEDKIHIAMRAIDCHDYEIVKV